MSWWLVRDSKRAEALLKALHDYTPPLPLFFEDEKGLLGVVVFEKYTGAGGSVTVHFAGFRKGWLKASILRACSWYVFGHLKCAQVMAEVNGTNLKVRRMAEKFGFVELYRVQGYFPGSDLCVYLLAKARCRYYREESDNGDACATSGAAV
jgi:RimJ/RimL family protein N-acetyltransferase